MIVNKLRRRLPTSQWQITVVDRDDEHRYQPGYLFLPSVPTPRSGGEAAAHVHPGRRRAGAL